MREHRIFWFTEGAVLIHMIIVMGLTQQEKLLTTGENAAVT